MSKEIIDKIRRKAEELTEIFDDNSGTVYIEDYHNAMQTYLLLQIFDKLESIDESIIGNTMTQVVYNEARAMRSKDSQWHAGFAKETTVGVFVNPLSKQEADRSATYLLPTGREPVRMEFEWEGKIYGGTAFYKGEAKED